jgi:cytochrome d ubiquinol oxidase subunit II
MLVPENLAAAVVLVGLIMYAVFAGADFGGGVWIALATGPRAREQRESLFHAIGPVWETNHVWLIFVVVTLFMAFPQGFAALFIALLVPFVIALVGINFRGAAYAFRHFDGHSLPATVQVFSISSLITPFTLGMAFTSVAAGHIHIVNGQVQGGLWSSWVTPFTIVGGLVAVTVCAFLTPIYMAVRTRGELREDFRTRGLIASIVLGVLTAIEVPIALLNSLPFVQRLFRPVPLAFVGLAVAFGVATLVLLWTRRYVWAQVSAAGTVAATMTGFAAALYPYLLIDELTFAQAAAPHATLVAYLYVLAGGIVILAPSLALLYWTFRGEPNPELPTNRS